MEPTTAAQLRRRAELLSLAATMLEDSLADVDREQGLIAVQAIRVKASQAMTMAGSYREQKLQREGIQQQVLGMLQVRHSNDARGG